MLVLAVISVRLIFSNNGVITKAQEAKILTVIGAIKEEIKLEQAGGVIDGKNLTVEGLLAEGKISRTVQQLEDGKYYLYYVIKPGSYNSMNGLGEGSKVERRDVFVIDDNINIKYIDNKGNEYGDNIEEKELKDDTQIQFASTKFGEFVSNKVGAEEDEVLFKWMKTQTSLSISDSEITSLEDLVFFPNLTSLEINNMTLKNLDGVENCKKLKTFFNYYASVEDWSRLSELNMLERVTSFSSKTDFENLIDAIKNIETLKTLELENVKVNGNMNKLSEMKGKLKSLIIRNAGIIKIEGLDNFVDSLTLLRLDNNKIEDISYLSKFVNLKDLQLSNNKIKNILPLSSLTSLTYLNLRGNPEIDGDRDNYSSSDVERLDKIGEITDRNGTILIDFEQIGLFKSYIELNLSNRNLTTLDILEGMTSLQTLNLNNNNITLEDKKSQDILKSLTNLKVLHMKNNNIKDLTPVNSLKKLKHLNIQGNPEINLKDIEDIISNLNENFLVVTNDQLKTIVNCNPEKITSLKLYTTITELPNLDSLTHLTSITIQSSQVIDYTTIENHTSLENLNLMYTNLHNKMLDLSKLRNLKTLTFHHCTLWSEDLENFKALKDLKNLTINLDSNSIIDASALLVLDPSTKIYLRNNVNLSEESKQALKERFGSNVTF